MAGAAASLVVASAPPTDERMTSKIERLLRRRGVHAGLMAVAAALVVGYWLRPLKVQLLADMPLEVSAEPIRQFRRGETAAPGGGAPADPAGGNRFGKLEFRGGLVLKSTNPYFGGWSGLALDADGRRLLAISDTGSWLTAELRYDRSIAAGLSPSGIADARIGPLRDADGAPFARGRDRDSEGLAVVAGTIEKGEALISFEQNHRVGRFPIGPDGVGPLQGYLPVPPETAQMSRNTGLEAVCVLRGSAHAGSVVILSERFPGSQSHVGWLGAAGPLSDTRAPGGNWRRLAIVSIDDFDLTDCHGLADGGMLVLERRFHLRDALSGPKMRLRRFTATEIASQAPMRGEVLVVAGPGEEIDNMEGLAVHTNAAGETIVTMISDDNFNHRLQRNVLLQFALPPPDPTDTPAATAPLGRP